MNQPRPAPVPAAIPAPPREPRTLRLLRTWVELTWRAASADAHRTGDDSSLYDLQQRVEEAITDLVPISTPVLAELWAWEATLIHVGDTPARDCLTCRRARSGPDLNLAELLTTTCFVPAGDAS